MCIGLHLPTPTPTFYHPFHGIEFFNPTLKGKEKLKFFLIFEGNDGYHSNKRKTSFSVETLVYQTQNQ